MTNATAAAGKPDFDVAIIGTGFAGQCMAIKLKESGQNDFVMLERAASVGGTWRDNTYPGCCCDVPSHLYSFSFAQNADWSRKYPSQPELYAYLKRLADEHGLMPHIRFGHAVTSTVYDENEKLWKLTSGAGMVTARVVVSGSGFLSEPVLPNIPGIDRFEGRIFHSARWDHQYDFSGKRVAVIGTGASAIQFVPQIAKKVSQMDVYQRTPPWIIPRPDRPISRIEKFLLHHVKPLQWLYRWIIYWGHEARVMGFVLHPSLMSIFQKRAAAHLARQVPDAQLRAKLTPTYRIGCKRILISNDWYPALQRPNVSLVTDAIAEIRAHGVVTRDGIERTVDAIVLGTGFYATDNPMAATIHGRGGKSLADVWKDGEEAFAGTLVNGFPNLFLLVGPNTGLGHSSMVFMIEAQVRFVMKCLALEKAQGLRSLEVRAEVQREYNRQLQEKLGGSIWATGCKSWYQNKNGKITALWPGWTFAFWWRLRDIHPADFVPAAKTGPA